ncbi:MAG: hypothetical protein CMM25_00560 [Rhodospirillaceae bacterium]|nr:hypothetical protein [Rhodospirillaceae bacterium]
MSKLVQATRQYDSLTANGAVTHSTSLHNCLDMFFMAGATRSWDEGSIIQLFLKAHSEDRDLAYRILFWARDCRGGAGEKRFFHVVAKFLAHHQPGSSLRDEWDALAFIVPEYGSWKDLFVVESPDLDRLNYLSIQLQENEHANLLAKWFPRKGPWFTAMHKYLKVTPKEFRKSLVAMTNVVETRMCQKEWSSIDYSKVPSIAMNKYRNAFMRKDADRFTDFNKDVLDGKAKVNASTLHPHQLIQALMSNEDANAVEAQWLSLPDYMEGSTERILPMCDVSGSMHGTPMDVSIALGLYISERNKSIFKDAVLTFSSEPTMHHIKGSNLVQRAVNLGHADWGMSTDLQKAFKLILDSAVREGLSESDMPTKLLIISDMEFNQATTGTNLDAIKQQYIDAGYVMPEVIFWNVNGRMGNVPARADEEGVGLVSGFSPSILTSILQGRVETPMDLMHKTISTDRYKAVTHNLSLFAE